VVSILTSFKPFVGEDEHRQVNALASWRALGPDVEILAFARSSGLERWSDRYGVQQVLDVPTFEGRLPRVDAVFAYAEEHARHEHLIYVNGDIILFRDLLRALGAIPLERWVLVGQRIDVDVRDELSFGDALADDMLRQRLRSVGRLHNVGGLDYFAWVRGSMPSLPPLYLGAAGWDNHAVFCCRRSGVAVVDATRALSVFHQDHPHLTTPDGGRDAYEGPAATSNLAHIGDVMHRLYTTDASFWLDEDLRLHSAYTSPRHAWRMVLNIPVVRGWPRVTRWPFRLAATLVRRLGEAQMRLEAHPLGIGDQPS